MRARIAIVSVLGLWLAAGCGGMGNGGGGPGGDDLAGSMGGGDGGGDSDLSDPNGGGGGDGGGGGGDDLAVMTSCTGAGTRCNGNTVETCNGSVYVATMLCPQSCAAGACTQAASCAPGGVRCNGTNVEICNASGSAWLYSQSCNVGCASGLCTDPCTAGATRCNGSTVETCNSTGTGWTAGAACATSCYQGGCIAADLVVDGVTMNLSGEHVYQNGVVVKNGGKIVVDGDGTLTLRAKTISVDATSSIVSNGTGDDTRGSMSTTTCTIFSHCHSGYLCCNGAQDTTTTVTLYPGGAGYGTQGASATVKGSAQCTGTDVDNAFASCPYGAGGPTYDRDDDTSISKGSKSGASLGGGLITLYADQITIAGQVLANGTGSASGGGILVAADSINAGGALQTVGGQTAPNGGQGRIKLLRGGTLTNTGSQVGKTDTSVSPPLTLVSGTHPDPTRWYNDGLGALGLAWARPFPSTNGYYWLFTQNASDVPSDQLGRGTFMMGESLTVPAASLKQGANYFHIIAVDSNFVLGTVEKSFKVQVNTQPPAVTSASHPVPRTWYDNPAVSLAWTNPQADSNFTGYYYVWDHFADTVPSTSVGTFTTNNKLIFSGVQNGIWVFHAVNRDTRGATTRAAQHFIVYVGTEPGKGNLSGSVIDGANGNAPLAGVTLSINRGLFTATTAPSVGTYTFNNTLYEGTWEVTASKPGYQPQRQMVTITANQTTNLNFTLTP